MCGIVGFIDYSKKSSESFLDEMLQTLKHRGPDHLGAEMFLDKHAAIGLGQTRLSVIDLSVAGNQPMQYQELAIVYNGEIYNFKEIKESLQTRGHEFISNSDTEVILHAFQEWGISCVDKFIGMFAFVIYDKKNSKVYFFRDRAGVKPFYYFIKNDIILFASELKALHKHPSFEKEIDVPALDIYFDYGYIPSPHTIFHHCYKLSPGNILGIDLRTRKKKSIQYWNVHDFYKKPENQINYQDAKTEVHRLLRSACEYRMIADVPVGVFLSGGYDSTAVVSLLQQYRTEKIKTFTIGFEEGNNEAPFAKETAKLLGTEHYEYYCKTEEAQKIIPELPYYYDEPFADSSAIPTMLVSKMAKQNVTVALSADAGDEVFAGYNSYQVLLNYSKKLNKIPSPLKPFAKTILKMGSCLISNQYLDLKHKIYGASYAINSNKNQQIANLVWKASSLPLHYAHKLFAHKNEKYTTSYEINAKDYRDELSVLLAIDYDMYLENDILTKVDRATMSVSLEGREPLLDHRLLEFSASLPSHFKYHGTVGKRILKDIVHEYVPKEIMDRPKTGFSLPIYSWLNKDLEYLLDEYLNEKSLQMSGLFNVSFVLRIVDMFRNDKLYYKTLIWKLLMFQMWYAKWMKK